MLIDDYLEYQINYEKKYGLKTIVLMQVGSFFEFYGINNEDEKIGDAQRITELLNIQLTRRNKAILENNRSNCLMAGFPTHSLKRFINILLSNNYTIILIEQVTEPPNPKREITQIYSPGTYIEEINQSDPNNIVSIYITEEKCYKLGKSLFIFGLSTIDLSTGISNVYQGNTLYYEKSAFFEEIYRFIEANNPKEIIISYNDLNKIKIDDIRSKINEINRVIHFLDNVPLHYFNINYQNSFLMKIFTKHGSLNPIEYINMEKKNYALISLIILLQFSYEHNEKIIDKIKIPTHWEYNDHLILYNNAIYQLNIIPTSTSSTSSCQSSNNKINSLFDIINKTSTSMGKRLLKYRLVNPITNIDELNKRYEMIDLFLKLNDNIFNDIHKILNEIIDIERLQRKISLQILHPYEFLNLSYSYDNIKKILSIIFSYFDISLFDINVSLINNFSEFINEYEKIFDMKEIGKYGLLNINNSFFKSNIHDKIDICQNKINDVNIFFEEQCKLLSNIIENDSDFVKMENNERDGYFLYTTKKRSEIMLNKLNKEQKKKYEIKKYNSTNVKIYSRELEENSNKLTELRNEINILTKEEYLNTLLYFDEKYMNILNEIVRFISIIDVIKCSALCAKIYKYNKPIINDLNNSQSFFDAIEIRHPIIEIINEKIDYVKNDIKLKHDETNGILLYGVNGSGKSSLSKAIGCNIILAQIGFYVPSKDFIYYPYKKIFTRINGDDNIFKGMSSFAVEMDELRSILKYADNRSIVLGDEVCKGTEETSALAIVTASILRFCENNVNFIFATHFHKLCSMESIKDHHNIKFKHLNIYYDKDNETIIYGRKLENGPGDNLYGIEIASFLINDSDFIKCAKSIRNNILNKNNELLVDKVSNYNNKLYVDSCSICGNTGNLYPLDTHHIKEQYNYDNYDINKDKLCNIVILCKKHHDDVHYNNLVINGYIDVIDGRKLDYFYKNMNSHNNENQSHNNENQSQISENITSRKKYGTNDIKLIKSLAIEYKDYIDFMKIMIQELKNKGLNISAKTIKKILNNEY
jgi:DNA mismatch repair protein MutS